MPTDTIDASELSQFLCIADADLGLISVFDDTKYDRADADVLSIGMRRHAIKHLEKIGFKQIRGNVLVHEELGARCIIPKFHALGASPFDVVRYTPKRKQDYYLLTPTQAACQMVDQYPTEEAVERIKTLIARQPINILRMMDFLDHSPTHRAFLPAIGHLKYVQRKAIETAPLRQMRPLG
ncbi:MAG: hypothetical protein AAGL90_12545 [Pseudomonadota bacterium]